MVSLIKTVPYCSICAFGFIPFPWAPFFWLVMLDLRLVRYAYLSNATLGKLYVAGKMFYTIERPWQDNKRRISCIPEGDYRLVNYSSARFPNAYHVLDVPDRSHILIHVGNYVEDVEGCIAAGAGFQFYNNRPMVTQSRLAMGMLKHITQSHELNLSIEHFCLTRGNNDGNS